MQAVPGACVYGERRTPARLRSEGTHDDTDSDGDER